MLRPGFRLARRQELDVEGPVEVGDVDGEHAGREPAEAGVLAASDPVLDAGVAAVPGFQKLDRAAAFLG